jgi:hypothetical protein
MCVMVLSAFVQVLSNFGKIEFFFVGRVLIVLLVYSVFRLRYLVVTQEHHWTTVEPCTSVCRGDFAAVGVLSLVVIVFFFIRKEQVNL